MQPHSRQQIQTPTLLAAHPQEIDRLPAPTPEMRGATDPVTSLDSGRPASAPGATDAPSNTAPQAPVQEEEKERMGRGRGKTRRKHVNEEQGSAASSARTSGAEEADDEAEDSESYRAKAAGTTKKRKRDTTGNKNIEGEAPVGGDWSIVARKLEDAEEDCRKFVLQAPLPDKYGLPAALAAQEEGEKGEDAETDDDILSLGGSEDGLTMEQIDSWFEERRIKRLAKEGADCRIEGVDDEEGDMEDDCRIEGVDDEEGDMDEDTESETDNLSFLGESDKEEVVDAKKDGDVSLEGERREEEGKRKNVDLDDILSQSESEEEDELHRSMERDMGPKRMELMDATWGWLFDTPDENKWKGPKGDDAKGEESWKEFHDLYASRLRTYYGYAKQADSNDWPTRVQDWPSDVYKCIDYRGTNCEAMIVQKRREIERLEEINRVSNFCLLLVTRKPYIEHNSDIGDLLKCLEKDGIIPLRVSTTLIIEAIKFLKDLLFNVEYFFHPLIREGYAEFLKLAVNMHFRVHRHELEEFYERTRIGSFSVLFPYLDRAIERRKNESEEAQNRNFSITPKILAEEFEIVKRDFKDLNMELIEVSLAERCLIMKLHHHIGAYAKHFTELLKNNQERSQFAEIVNEIIEGSNDVLVDHKLSQMLHVIHEKYFSTVPEYYAVQGIMHYLELSASNKDNKKMDYEELLSSWCLEKCNFINWLWRKTRSYDEKPHNAMRQPFMAGISIW